MSRLEQARIEDWALSVIRRVKDSHIVEDARIELKADWPEHYKAARRIAGHANSAHGNHILWLIGIDESTGAISKLSDDIATWWRSVRAYFDGVTPELSELAIHLEEGVVYALYFETSRAPYLVKNPAHGQQGGGPVALEVPWREGTSVRTATRNDLIQILVPQVLTPDISILSGYIHFSEREEGQTHSELFISCELYIIPKGDERLVFPRHLQSLETFINNELIAPTPEFYFPSPNSPLIPTLKSSFTIESTSSELIVSGPGKFSLTIRAGFGANPNLLQSDNIKIKAAFKAINSPLPALVEMKSSDYLSSTPQSAKFAWSIIPG